MTKEQRDLRLKDLIARLSDVDLEKCFETLYLTLDIMIEEYSKLDGFNYIVNKLKRIKEKIGYIDIDTFDAL